MQQVRSETHHFLPLLHKAISLQMKIIGNCVISIAERWLLPVNNHLSVITIKSYLAIRTMKFSLLISQAI